MDYCALHHPESVRHPDNLNGKSQSVEITVIIQALEHTSIGNIIKRTLIIQMQALKSFFIAENIDTFLEKNEINTLAPVL